MDRISRITSFRRPTGLTTIRWAFVEKHSVLPGPSRITFQGTRTDGPPSTTTGAKMLNALLSRWCDPVMGGSPPGSAGVPPAQILPQLQPSPPPESTGSGALPLLRPGPCSSRRQGGQLQHRVARKLSGNRSNSMRAWTPALPGAITPHLRRSRRSRAVRRRLMRLGGGRGPPGCGPRRRQVASAPF